MNVIGYATKLYYTASVQYTLTEVYQIIPK